MNGRFSVVLLHFGYLNDKYTKLMYQIKLHGININEWRE